MAQALISLGKARPLARRLTAACTALAMAAAGLIAGPAAPAQAQSSQSLSIVRDAEIEALLREYANPIFRAAGVNESATEIILVNNRSFNAFVANGRRIFINVGAIMDSETPNELIGVIAHETGHIAGGHLARLRQEVANAQILSVVSMLLGAGAAIGSARGGNIGDPGLGAAGVMGGGMEAAQRTLLAYQRSEEQAADQAAVRFLTATGQSPMGMINTFRRFQDTAMFRTSGLDPYLLSHPLPAERIAQLERLASQSPHRDRKDPPALQARHDLARAKLFGFVERPETVMRRYPPGDNSLAARYARAIVMHRSGRMNDSLALIDSLIQAQSRNAYFHELRGQVLLESARPRDAVASLRRAVSLSDAPPIRTLYAQALLALGDAASIAEATRQLQNVTSREPENPEAFRHLAMAHGRAGQIALAELAMANSYFHAGDIRNAQNQAHRAMAKLPAGSPERRRAEAIFNHVPTRN